jgi:2-keto-3-deoxy-L-rhamnonate aldolase RhmA
MPSRGRHQSTSKECQRAIAKIEAMPGVIGVIIGRSYGGKSLGQENSTGSIRIQRPVSGGLKAVTQTEKGLQELFIRTEAGMEDEITESIKLLDS